MPALASALEPRARLDGLTPARRTRAVYLPALAGFPPHLTAILGLLPVLEINGTLIADLAARRPFRAAPPIAGLFACDPFLRVADMAGALRRAGITAVINYPTVQSFEGETAAALAAVGYRAEAEFRVLQRLAEHGLSPIACAMTRDAADAALDPFARVEAHGSALAEAARRAQLPKVVILSSIGAQHASGTGVIATLHRFESLLGDVAPSTVFLRPGYFVETWGEVADAVVTEGVLPSFLDPSQRIPMVSTIDVGSAAASLLGEAWSGTRIVQLGGPEDWSAGDVAAAFAEVLGRPVMPVLVPPEKRLPTLVDAGVPAEVAVALLGMYECIAKGLVAWQAGGEQRRGTTPLAKAIERLLSSHEMADGGYASNGRPPNAPAAIWPICPPGEGPDFVQGKPGWPEMIVAVLVLVVVLASCTSTPPFRGPDGRPLDGSVAEMADLPLNGARQRIWLRGASTRNPLLVLVHGGPGASESALFRAFVPELERHFLVVYWEQRGTGRSFDPAISAETMRIDQFVADLHALIVALRTRFGAGPAIVVAHSWGTAPGLLHASRHPGDLLAYVGIAQAVDMPEGERISWESALNEAERRGDAAAIAALRSIGPPPHDVDAMLVSRRWNERFGGAFHAPDLSTGALIWRALQQSEVGLYDLWLFGRGNRWSLDLLWPEFRQLRLWHIRHLDVPVFLIQGRHDRQVPSSLAETPRQRAHERAQRVERGQLAQRAARFGQGEQAARRPRGPVVGHGGGRHALVLPFFFGLAGAERAATFFGAFFAGEFRLAPVFTGSALTAIGALAASRSSLKLSSMHCA
ncbi:alpha/beta fold hydrolase [Leptolyngbya sp. 15MV]|nr:alpha/beta fold hydrolase [Leptolyngbya sp. 15MV]